MKILRLLLGRRGATRRGAPPAVEAALRAKRARDHLARKRRRDGWDSSRTIEGGRASGSDAEANLGSVFAALPTGGQDAPLMSSRPISPARIALPLPDAIGAAPDSMDARPKPAAGRPSRRDGGEPAPFELEPSELAPPRRGGSSRRAAAPSASAAPGASPSGRPTSRARRAAPRASASRTVGPVRVLPRLVVPGCTLVAVGLGFALGRPLFERAWLPQVPFRRVAVVGASVREPMTIAQALLAQAGAPLDRLTPEGVRAVVLSDPWLASADSLRLPDGTLLLRVRERRAIARYRGSADEPEALVDPEGHRFLGDVAEGGPLPLVDGPVASESSLPAATLEILAELRRHTGLSPHLSALILHLPLADGAATKRSARSKAASTSAPGAPSPAALDDESLAGETGYVLELGEQGPRALLGQTALKRRVARLASLLEQRDGLVAGARIIDLRYADRAVLRTEPTSG